MTACVWTRPSRPARQEPSSSTARPARSGGCTPAHCPSTSRTPAAASVERTKKSALQVLLVIVGPGDLRFLYLGSDKSAWLVGKIAATAFQKDALLSADEISKQTKDAALAFDFKLDDTPAAVASGLRRAAPSAC